MAVSEIRLDLRPGSRPGDATSSSTLYKNGSIMRKHISIWPPESRKTDNPPPAISDILVSSSLQFWSCDSSNDFDGSGCFDSFESPDNSERNETTDRFCVAAHLGSLKTNQTDNPLSFLTRCENFGAFIIIHTK